jgi:hypothetical protein
MTTKNEMIEIIRAENPNGLRVGDDERGYTQLTADEYEQEIDRMAAIRLEEKAEQKQVKKAKELAQSKLAALGLTADDLKALGL